MIGGLIFSTFTTLLVLPAIYALLQRKAPPSLRIHSTLKILRAATMSKL